MFGCLIRGVRVVGIGEDAPSRSGGRRPEPVDIRIVDGVVTAIGPHLSRSAGETVHDGGGRWAIPGLWDAHVHMGQWAAATMRLDVADVTDSADACARIAQHIATLPPERGEESVSAFGFRCAAWTTLPTVAALDAVSGRHPVVLISGDCHSGWLNSRALELLGLAPRDGILVEDEWFDVFPRLDSLPGLADLTTAGYRAAMISASAKGVTGILDLEFTRGVDQWPSRFADQGIDALRVRVGTYADGLDEVIAAGLRTGDPLPGTDGLVTMGPLKIISDGSLNTRTAFCCEPYADAADLPDPYGIQNVDPEELRRRLTLARDNGLEIALHAIGDAAARDALDAFEATGARGTIEHAQLMRISDIPRMARLGIGAGVQPAHLWDDRDVARQCWPDREERCFVFRTMLDHGVRLLLGSDAPVAPLDPWLAMAAAVHRSNDEREPWNASEALTVAEALAASVDDQGTLHVGGRGDVALLDAYPYAVPSDSREACAALREMPVAATFVAGRLTHG